MKGASLSRLNLPIFAREPRVLSYPGVIQTPVGVTLESS
jgi:hypothetical protein